MMTDASSSPAERSAGPAASVIIVNYNSAVPLRACLSSLVDSTCDAEVIVVDSASSGGVPPELVSAFPSVQFIASDVNAGFGAGSNLGARRARGRFLAFLNPDTLVTPQWLSLLIACLETEPRAGLATPKILLAAQPDKINTCGNDMHYTGLTLCRGLGAPRGAYAERADVSAVSGAAFVVSRELFAQLGGFDEKYFMYMEDADLSWRVRLLGQRCVYVPEAIVYHDYSLRIGSLKTYYQERNRYRLLFKALRWRTLLTLLPALCLAELTTWGFVILRDRARFFNKLRAYASVARHWAELMRARGQTQCLRHVRDRELIAQCTARLDFEQTGPSLAAAAARRVLEPLYARYQQIALGLMRW